MPAILWFPAWTWKSCAASSPTLSPKIFRVVIDTLISEKLIAREENLLRLASHQVQLGGQEKTLMDKIKKILGEQPLAPPDLKDIEKQAGVPRNRFNEVIRLLERDGSVVRSHHRYVFSRRAASTNCSKPAAKIP